MDLLRYWRSAGNRRWLLVVVPLTAALAAATIGLVRPKQYAATATITIDSVERAGTPPAVNQVIANFEALLKTTTVTNRVSERAHVPAGDVKAGLSVKGIGGGNIAEVRYESSHKADVARVARIAALEAHDLLYESELLRARTEADIVRKQLNDVIKRREAFLKEVGVQLPEEEYDLRSHELSELRISLAKAQIDGGSDAQALQKVVDQKTKEVDRLEGYVARYRLMRDEENRATTLLLSAEQQEALVEGVARMGESGGLTVTAVHALSRSSGIVNLFVSGALVGLLIAAVIVGMAVGAIPLPRPRREEVGERTAPADGDGERTSPTVPAWDESVFTQW